MRGKQGWQAANMCPGQAGGRGWTRATVAFAALCCVAFPVHPADASEIVGPARFCGYAPVIDLLPGEKVTTLAGGIHYDSFRWDGEFGSLEVAGSGWAPRPSGRMIRAPENATPARFAPQRHGGRYTIAIWNGSHDIAYFTSVKPFSALQIAAIDRVKLFEEGQEPAGCDLRTVFVVQ